MPTAIPSEATTQIIAAVVRPRTSSPCLRMLPAPRKPTPVTIWAAIRVGSTVLPKIGIRPSPVNKHEPAPMSAIVRIPAAWPLIERSVPSGRPITSATKTRKARSNSPESGVLSAPAGTTSGPVLRAGFVLRAWLVGKLGEVQAVHEVAEHGEPLLVDDSLHLVFVPFGLVGLGDDAGGLHHLGGDEDRAFDSDGERDGVRRPRVEVQVAPVFVHIEAEKGKSLEYWSTDRSHK